MPDAHAVSLGLAPPAAPPWRPWLDRRWIVAGAAGLSIAAASIVNFPIPEGGLQSLGWEQRAKAPPALTVTPVQKQALADLTVDDGAQIVVTGTLAENRNAAIPLSGLPIERLGGVALASAQPATALTCLTQAVYYEAGFEPAGGKRAVAQVVLNRMRHPAYPKSVCGVVYQGSERRTGCQFSFTCDGSLLRAPSAAAWIAAQEVARAALAGFVEPSVGTATHYHADYVLPKWAFQLGKIRQIGAHIFYRFQGRWGSAGAFTGVYSGREWIPPLNQQALRERQANAALLGPTVAGSTTARTTAPQALVDSKYPKDEGGRVNVTKLWRMTGAATAESRGGDSLVPSLEELKPLPVSNSAASVIPEE